VLNAWRIGVDSGGTLTDVRLFDEASGAVAVWNVCLTDGFRDLLEIGRQKRPDLYNLAEAFAAASRPRTATGRHHGHPPRHEKHVEPHLNLMIELQHSQGGLLAAHHLFAPRRPDIRPRLMVGCKQPTLRLGRSP
jgi:hypothetical protein